MKITWLQLGVLVYTAHTMMELLLTLKVPGTEFVCSNFHSMIFKEISQLLIEMPVKVMLSELIHIYNNVD